LSGNRIAAVPEPSKNDWELRYEAALDGPGSELIVSPKTRRYWWWLLACVVVGGALLGLWMNANEGRARSQVARGDGVPGAFRLDEYIEPAGAPRPSIAEWRGHFTSTDRSVDRVAWLTDRLPESAKAGDVVDVAWSRLTPDMVYLPERATDDWLGGFIVTVIFMVVVGVGYVWWRIRRQYRRA
jgi:hypothetical protein